MKEITVVIGAGLTGLSTAYHMESKYAASGNNYSRKCFVIEKEATAGGLCRSFYHKGFTFDTGGHFLHTEDNYVKSLVEKLLKGNSKLVKRNSKIFIKDRFIPYPFQGNLYYLPDEMKVECLSEYIKAYVSNNNDKAANGKNFREWMRSNFGDGIAKYFMEPFNRKLLKVSLEEISAEAMKRYIPVPDMNEIVSGALCKSRKAFGYNHEFYYPAKNGIQSFVNSFKAGLKNIITSAEVIKINSKKKNLKLNTGPEISYDNLVSTMPLSELVKCISDAPEIVKKAGNNLRCNSLLIVNVGFRGKPAGKMHWIYLPEEEYECYRIGFYSEVAGSMAPKGMTSAYVEFSVNRGKEKTDIKGLEKKAIECLKKMKFIKGKKDILSCQSVFVDYGYVIFDSNREQCVGTIKDYLNNNGIYSEGRYGGWEYSTMSDAIISGKKMAEKILMG
ncbi:MAG: FAD-dependent oxidoreductase [Candidatus Schekmanbacteria bacterium]|nr:FAD-dependent oxidoreductase [Candidatus Schekmanbacteria bacterium]